MLSCFLWITHAPLPARAKPPWATGVALTHTSPKIPTHCTGESDWNVKNIFTGWVDVPLTDKGCAEAAAGGKLIAEAGLEFDIAFTSLQKRAIKTCFLALESADQLWIPQKRSWRLNERMYGGLEGMNKTECVERYGADQVLIWRRSFDIPPPPMESGSEFDHTNERKYKGIDGTVPMTECLKDCIERVVPYWEKEIVPELKAGKTVLIAAHGNSLRGLVKYLDGISEKDILELNIPTGVPLVYQLDDNMKPIPAEGTPFAPLTGMYLGDVADVKARIEGVANQTKKK